MIIRKTPARKHHPANLARSDCTGCRIVQVSTNGDRCARRPVPGSGYVSGRSSRPSSSARSARATAPPLSASPGELIRPLSLLALYTFVFSTVMKVRFGENGSTTDFVFYLFCGLVPAGVFRWHHQGDDRDPRSILAGQTDTLSLRSAATHQVLVALAIESLGLVVLLGALLVVGRVPGWPLLALAAIVIPHPVHDRPGLGAGDAFGAAL